MGSRFRRPFTPQDSPPQASSSNDGEDHDASDAVVERAVPQAQSLALRSSPAIPPALQAWTAHQSHAQATILFYVPRTSHTEDLDVTIGDDYVIAGLRGREAIIKARLARPINPKTSTWQLERRRTGKRHRSVSLFGRGKQRRSDQSSSQSGDSSGTGSDKGGSGLEKDKGHAQATPLEGQTSASDMHAHFASPVTPQQHSFQSHIGQHESDLAGQERERGSQALPLLESQDSALSSSIDTLASSSSQTSQDSDEKSDAKRGVRGRNARHGTSSASHPATPTSLSQSMTLSDESEYVRPASIGVRSLDSSISAAERTSRAAGSSSARSRDELDDEEDATIDARLVTLHLDKVDGGMWSCYVSGPAPVIRNQASAEAPHLLSHRSQTSLSAALSEALEGRQKTGQEQAGHSRTTSHSNGSEVSGDERGPNASTLTVDTVGSDDSTTILGVRTSDEDDAYNMDPISLTLMGLQCARRSISAPISMSNAREGSLAFEYFRRAWRQGDVPMATERLVDDYLPLPPVRKARSDEDGQSKGLFDSLRPRLVAALGGPTTLARLYLSYARLDLPSSAHRRPLLSLPITGQLINPFGSHTSHEHTYHASSPGGPSSPEGAGARNSLLYLEEVCRLDAHVASTITEVEWREAAERDDYIRSLMQSASSPARSQRGALSPSSYSELGGYDSASSHGAGLWRSSGYDDTAAARRQQRAERKRRRKGRGKGMSEKTGTSAADQGLVFLVVSRAALLSVVVAGGMAVAGWWRRAAAAGGG